VQVADATCCAMIRIVVGVGDLVLMTEHGRTGRVLGGRAIERLGGAVCGVQHARRDKEREFLG
jgi:hypothetical protein